MKRTEQLPEEKRAMLEKWKASGKRIKQYCMEENILYHTMSYWHGKKKKLATSSDKKFIKLQASTSPILSSNRTEVIYSNGNRIIFYGKINANELKQLASTNSATW